MFVLGYVLGAVSFAVVFNFIHKRILLAFQSHVDTLMDKINEVFKKAVEVSEKEGAKLSEIIKKI